MKDVPEPVNVIIGHADGLVILNVVGVESSEVYWHIKFQPQHARDLAATLTWNSMQAGGENTPGW